LSNVRTGSRNFGHRTLNTKKLAQHAEHGSTMFNIRLENEEEQMKQQIIWNQPMTFKIRFKIM